MLSCRLILAGFARRLILGKEVVLSVEVSCLRLLIGMLPLLLLS